MLIFASFIARAAREAGMKTPTFEHKKEEWDEDEFPHFAVFCKIQLGRSMSSPSQHWENAKIIAAIPDDMIRKVTLKDLLAMGVDVT